MIFLPGYAHSMNDIGKDVVVLISRRDFEAQRGPSGALLVGSREEVIERIIRHCEAL